MTKDKDEKAVVRARMTRTGESYTAARARLHRSAPIDLKRLPPGTAISVEELPPGLRVVPDDAPACSFCTMRIFPVVSTREDEDHPIPVHICASCATLAVTVLAEEHDSRGVVGRDEAGRAISAAPEHLSQLLPEAVNRVAQALRAVDDATGEGATTDPR